MIALDLLNKSPAVLQRRFRKDYPVEVREAAKRVQPRRKGKAKSKAAMRRKRGLAVPVPPRELIHP